MSKILENILFTSVEGSNKYFSPHFHNSYTIGITYSGLFKSYNQNNTFNFYEKSTRINNPYELHSGDSKSWANFHMYVNKEFMQDLYFQIYEKSDLPLFYNHILEDLISYEKVKNIYLAYNFNKDKEVLESTIIEALSYLILNYTKKQSLLDKEFNNSLIIKNSLELINDKLAVNLSLEDLSQNVNLSKYHFLRVFKKELGITPHQYILNQRVEKAKALLSKGHSIVNAALEVGFNDQSHFNRNFKKFYDVSPLMIKKQ